MRVQCVQLHGFKSFALPTRLEFDAGVGAIVGPNGSGKSNLVEAVRWVLGEQSLSQLRGRRSEDLIWAGSPRRAGTGMAEVAITFDNTDHSLPSPYAEVTVIRRAYRSGENEYLINGARVRLKDIAELTAAIGQGYTIVGQGTADAVLSLTPQGRRGIFEAAADITQHYSRRDDALRRLAQIENNTERVRDLLSELEPRLRALSRQARQAKEREREEQRLRSLLVALYARDLARSRQRVDEAEKQLQAAERAARELEDKLVQLRADGQEAARRAAKLATRVAELERSCDSAAAERGWVARELNSASSRASEAEARLRSAEAVLATTLESRRALETQLDRLRSEHAAATEEAATLGASLQRAELERADDSAD
ncbi:MAG: AAA family ATPase, partial [Chloroflexota bacterium]|nr:AAA family ATPase [Chloroflexota bacterium]